MSAILNSKFSVIPKIEYEKLKMSLTILIYEYSLTKISIQFLKNL